MRLFVDTNLPLHHQPLHQIDWKEVTGSDDVTLIFSVVIFDELDQHTRNPRLATRAKRARKDLYGYTESGIVKGTVKAESILKPNTKILEEHNMDPQQNDQWILGTIKDYIKTNPSENVALLTADVGMRIRARAYGISVVMLDDKYKLDEESDEQKEIKKLKAENEKLKAAVPQLGMAFETGNVVTFKLHRPNYEKYVQDEIRRMEYRDYPRVSDSETFSYRLNREYTRQDAITYNSQLNEYYKAYEAYLKERKNLYFAETLTLKLDSILKNTGLVPGKNIDIEILFPANMLVSERSANKRIPEPNKKNPPVLGVLKPLTWSYETNQNYYQRPEPESLIKVTEMTDGTTRVDFHVAILKQQMDIRIPPIYVTFYTETDVHGFNIEYALRSENVPDVVKGALNVKADFGEEEAPMDETTINVN
jgi:hypothetical protein